jgi:hypothetical protein
MTCSSCKYFTENKFEETCLEQIERENKPLPIGFIQNFHSIFRPSKYRSYRDDVDEIIDSIILDNREKGYCSRFPRGTVVYKTYSCGEYKPKP